MNPSAASRVAAMASMFQQAEEKEDSKDQIVKKGRQSLPLSKEAGFAKQKAALKRSNSQKDRFSSAKKMFEKRGSGDNLLDSSRTSITSTVSNVSISQNIKTVSPRQSMSLVSSISSMEDEDIQPTENENDQLKNEVKSNKENTHQIKSSIVKSFHPIQALVLSPNRQLRSTGHSKLDVREFFDLNTEKSPLENSTPPPLPSLPPPTMSTSLLGDDDIVLNTNNSPTNCFTQPDSLDIDTARKISFCDNRDRKSYSPTQQVAVSDSPAKFLPSSVLSPLTSQDRTDSQSTLLEYAELCESLPSVEFVKMEEEFDRLADMTDLSQVDDQSDENANDEDEIPGTVIDQLTKYSGCPRVERDNIKVGASTSVELRTEFKTDEFESSLLNSSDVEEPGVNDKLCAVPPSPGVGVKEDEEEIMLITEIKVDKDMRREQNKSEVMNETQYKTIDKSATTSDDGNTSSLGSSLVGQSVSSWLGTPGSVSAESCISADPSPQTGSGNNYNCSKYVPSTEESSDYVSGNSAELGTSSSVISTESVLYSWPQDGDEAKFHYLCDGNFWVEGPPLIPTSQLEEIPEKMYHPPSVVQFSSSPVRIFSTFTEDEYDRKNEDIDPAVASAEYELEKRVEEMETFEVSLIKEEGGLGLSILGMGVGVDTGVEKLGIFIKTITTGGAADKDGRIQVNDQIISVDGSCLVGVTQEFAASVLRNTAGLVQFVVGRDKDPGDSDVAQLIRQCVQADLDEADNDDQSVVEEDISSEGISLATSSSVEGEHSFGGENQDMSCEEEGFQVTPLSEDIQTEGRNKENQVKEDASDNVGGNREKVFDMDKVGVDSSDKAIPEENNANTSAVISNDVQQFTVEVELETPKPCCDREEKYKRLLAKYEQSQECIGQLKRNLSIVTDQLVSRDQLFSTHMARLKEVFSHLEMQLNYNDKEAFSQQSLWCTLEPRGALRRKPFIPTDVCAADHADLPTCSLDLAIPPTPLLDTSLARDKVILVHRGTLARRRNRGRQITNTDTVEDGQGQEVATDKVVGGSTFQNELRKNLMNNSRVPKTVSKGMSDSSGPPVSPGRACSLPCSPTISRYSSSSSLQSAPGSNEVTTEFKREKKRLSGKNLWQKARRRLSSR